uniref:Zgc:113424 n=1 Tax=Paramormyrops kingsleyae TaxID=1676925 RepID=A0A3B3QAV7_9TELE|nr:forkhead box protein H1-like [Paramormyrops kingsleyae]
MKNCITATMPATSRNRTYLYTQDSSGGLQRRKYKRYCKPRSTYLGLIANAIQGSPSKRLTFCQIMDKLQTVISGDRKGLQNNIRVCLTSSDCFLKVPVNPESPNPRKNFWRIDESRITPQMLRRHFKGMEHIFPDLASRSMRDAETGGENHVTAPVMDSSGRENCAVKFSGPFSIESLLRKDNSCSVGKVQPISHGSPQKVGQELLHTKRRNATKRKCSWDTRVHDLWDTGRGHCVQANFAGDHGYTAIYSDNTAMPRKRACFSADLPFPYYPLLNIPFQLNESWNLVKVSPYYTHQFRL